MFSCIIPGEVVFPSFYLEHTATPSAEEVRECIISFFLENKEIVFICTIQMIISLMHE
jgi:ribosomal protein S24E